MRKQKQKMHFLCFGVFFLFVFFFAGTQSVFACQWSVAQWGGTLSGQCKSTCLSSPKEESALGTLSGCGENESCCIPNPNLDKPCSVSASGPARSGTCKVSSDCSGSNEGLSGDPCSSTSLVCCVPKSTGEGACSGSYMSGHPASGTCAAGASSCSGGRVFVGTCTGGICCATPEGSGTGSSGGTSGGSGGSGGTSGGSGGSGGTIGGSGGGGGTIGGSGGGGGAIGGVGGGSGASPCSGGGMIAVGPTFVPGGACLPDTPISVLIIYFLQWLLYIFGFLSVLAFVISGVMYLTSAGDDSMIDRAKEYMVWSIVGVIVALSGLIIVNAINSWLHGSSYYF